MRFSTVIIATLSAAATGFAQEMSLTGGDGAYSLPIYEPYIQYQAW